MQGTPEEIISPEAPTWIYDTSFDVDIIKGKRIGGYYSS